MDYLDGSTLFEIQKEKGPQKAEDIVRKMIPVANALSRLHASGLIHRDISPENLMEEKDGSVKLMDFLDEQRMCRLYEKFILEYYRKEHPELTANASRIPWQLEDGFDELLPILQTDIMLTYHYRCGRKIINFFLKRK